VKEELDQAKRLLSQKKLILFSRMLGIKEDGDLWALK
jgi:hypothetical protein